jgi:hypothetical protein
LKVRLYMNHHVPAAVTQQLRRRAVDCLTCADDATEELDDEPLPARATQLGRIVFTQDTDFLEITNRLLRQGTEFAGLISAPQLGITIGQLVLDLELIAGASEAEELRNQILFLPL